MISGRRWYWIISDLLSHILEGSLAEIHFFLFTAVAQRNFFVFFFLQYKIRSSTKKHNKTTRFLMIFAGKFLLCVGQFFYFFMGVKDNRNSFTLNEFGIDVFGINFLRRRWILWWGDVRSKIKTFLFFWQSKDWIFSYFHVFRSF